MRRCLLSYAGVIGFRPNDDDDLLTPQHEFQKDRMGYAGVLEDRDAEMKMMIKMK